MAARDAIRRGSAASYLPDSPRMYKNKAKNAQEAHECIRPTDMDRDPGKPEDLRTPTSASSTT